MTATSPCSKASRRSQAKKKQLWALYEAMTTGARRRVGNERQTIALSELFASHSLQSQGKKVVCILISMNKNVKIINTTKIIP